MSSVCVQKHSDGHPHILGPASHHHIPPNRLNLWERPSCQSLAVTCAPQTLLMWLGPNHTRGNATVNATVWVVIAEKSNWDPFSWYNNKHNNNNNHHKEEYHCSSIIKEYHNLDSEWEKKQDSYFTQNCAALADALPNGQVVLTDISDIQWRYQLNRWLHRPSFHWSIRCHMLSVDRRMGVFRL